MNSAFIIQQLISGISIGLAYALIAIGYSMVYGILKFINFGHGAIYMVGTYIGYFSWVFLMTRLPRFTSFILATILAIIMGAIFGVLMERVAYKPTRGKGRLTTFMSSVGVSMFITYGVEYLLGPQPKPVPDLFPDFLLEVGGAYITGMQIFILVVALSLLVCLQLFVSKSRMGRAIRACSQDMGAANLMGVNTDQAISWTFAIGSGLASISGIMIGIYYNTVYPTMGWLAGIKAFICAVTGGIGSIPGAMVGGLLVGLAENLGAGFVASGYRDAIAFGFLILVMLIRPSGIFAKEQRSSL
jgi:branched-chain amino acid transport system permease protein